MAELGFEPIGSASRVHALNHNTQIQEVHTRQSDGSPKMSVSESPEPGNMLLYMTKRTLNMSLQIMTRDNPGGSDIFTSVRLIRGRQKGQSQRKDMRCWKLES